MFIFTYLILIILNSSNACSIELDDQVIVTGGVLGMTRVDVYTMQGWSRRLADLNIGRYKHGCGQYTNDEDKMVNCMTVDYC